MSRVLRLSALWVPVTLYGAAVFYLSSLPVALVGRFPDYLSHPLEYAGLAILIVRALNGGLDGPIPWRLHFWAVGLAVLFAVSDEIHQLHVPRRTASLKDVFSDALGAVLAVGLAEVLQRSLRRGHGFPPVPVILYTRKECHLCHDARDILNRLSRELPLRISEVDVDSRTEMVGRFNREVPVVMAAGVKISKLRPDEGAIRRRLLQIASRSR